LPQGQGTVSVGCFFASGCRQTGHFLLHILDQPFSTNRLHAGGRVMLTDHGVEFFPLPKRCEERERFPVGCYRSG